MSFRASRLGRVLSTVLAVCALLRGIACGARTPLRVEEDPVDASVPVFDARPPEPDARTGLLLDCPTELGDPRLEPGQPGLATFIDGRQFARAEIRAWQWRALPQGCDATLPAPRYEISQTTSSEVRFMPGRPGSHWFELQVESVGGDVDACVFELPVAGQGVYVEACWDTSTSTDLDLYLHRPNDQSDWFVEGTSAVIPGLDGNTCNGCNCVPDLRFGQLRVDWGYPDSPLLRCQQEPDFAAFSAIGRCPNPRFTVDNNQSDASGTAEVLELDRPRPGETFRIMVQNFENLPARPWVFVFCAGQLAGEFPPPRWPAEFIDESARTFGVMWRPCDITPVVDDGGVTVGCEAVALRGRDGYEGLVTVDDPRY